MLATEEKERLREQTRNSVYIIAYTIRTDPQKMFLDISSSALTTKEEISTCVINAQEEMLSDSETREYDHYTS